VVARQRGDVPLHRGDPHPGLRQRDGARHHPSRAARVPEPLSPRGAREDRLRDPGRHPARLPHALRPDHPGRREDHPARDGRGADRAEPRHRRPAGREPRVQLRAAQRGDEEPGRASRLLRLPRRAARDRECAARCATGSPRSRIRS
jgi:hypothetical protein